MRGSFLATEVDGYRRELLSDYLPGRMNPFIVILFSVFTLCFSGDVLGEAAVRSQYAQAAVKEDPMSAILKSLFPGQEKKPAPATKRTQHRVRSHEEDGRYTEDVSVTETDEVSGEANTATIKKSLTPKASSETKDTTPKEDSEAEQFYRQHFAAESRVTLDVVVVHSGNKDFVPDARVAVSKLTMVKGSGFVSEDEIAIGYTNDKGKYRAEGVPPGEYVIRVRSKKFSDAEKRITVHPEKGAILGVELDPL